MKIVYSVYDMPRVPAVYAMYGGRNQKYVAYVGIGANLRRRIHQHLIGRDSSVATGTSASGINPDYITEKILDYYNGHFEDINPKMLTFCTINLILNDLKKEFNLSNTWKNNSLVRLKNSLKDKSISDYFVH